jgi:hypothetical protein
MKECKKLLAKQEKTSEHDTGTQDSQVKSGHHDKGHHTAAAANHGPKQPHNEERAWAVSHQSQQITTGTRVGPQYLDSAATLYMTNWRVGRNYVLYLRGAHGTLMTAGQDNGQEASKDRGRGAG